MARRLRIEAKILGWLSSPRDGEYSSARRIAHDIREPIELVEFYLFKLAIMGATRGMFAENGEHLVRNQWIRPKKARSARQN